MANLNILTAPYTVAAAGAPVVLTLASPETGDPEYASVFFSLDNYFAGESITLNDVTFTAVAGPELGYLEFIAGVSQLLASFYDTPLEADYINTENAIIAKRPGPAWNLRVSSTGTPPIATEAVPHLLNQRYPCVNWGCYLEIYAYATDPQDRDYPHEPDPAYGELRAHRLTRLELPESTVNSYAFDLAPWLQSVVESAGRCVAYFLKYGEVYATPTNPYRSRYEVGRWPASGVAWAFDAAHAGLADYADPREPRLLTDFHGMRPLCLLPGYEAAVFHLSAVCDTAGGLTVTRTMQLADGTDVTPAALHWSVPQGGVYDGPAPYALALQPVPPTLQRLSLRRVDDVDGASIEEITYEVPATTLPHWLRWRNRLGGIEAWGFAATEAGLQRQSSTFSPVDGSTQTRRVDLTQSQRLTSGLLSRDAFDFLSTELAASADVSYFTTATGYNGLTPNGVNITDLDLKSDVLTGEYTIALTITPRDLFLPLVR